MTGDFGYCATGSHPYAIKEACIIIALRLWKRKDAIFGVAGLSAMGEVIKQSKITADADLKALLATYERDYF